MKVSTVSYLGHKGDFLFNDSCSMLCLHWSLYSENVTKLYCAYQNRNLTWTESRSVCKHSIFYCVGFSNFDGSLFPFLQANIHIQIYPYKCGSWNQTRIKNNFCPLPAYSRVEMFCSHRSRGEEMLPWVIPSLYTI